MGAPQITLHPDEVAVLLAMVREIVPSALGCAARNIALYGLTMEPAEEGLVSISAFAAEDLLEVLDEFPKVVKTPLRETVHGYLRDMILPIKARLQAERVALRRRAATGLDGYAHPELPF